MLRNNFIRDEGPLEEHGFLIGVQIEPGTSIELVMDRLLRSVTFVEGVGKAECEHLGLIESYVDEVVEADGN